MIILLYVIVKSLYNAFYDWLLTVTCPLDKTSYLPLVHRYPPLQKLLAYFPIRVLLHLIYEGITCLMSWLRTKYGIPFELNFS